MRIQLLWNTPIILGSSTTLRETMKNFDLKELPTSAGIYMFYRQMKNGSQEVLYIGQTTNIRSRMKDHFNSLKLVEWLEDTQQGSKMLVFADIKTRGDLAYALNQAEKSLIQHFSDNEHPLLNMKLMPDRFDEIESIFTENDAIDVLNDTFYAYSVK